MKRMVGNSYDLIKPKIKGNKVSGGVDDEQ
jgi:hypothetical protein